MLNENFLRISSTSAFWVDQIDITRIISQCGKIVSHSVRNSTAWSIGLKGFNERQFKSHTWEGNSKNGAGSRYQGMWKSFR